MDTTTFRRFLSEKVKMTEADKHEVLRIRENKTKGLEEEHMVKSIPKDIQKTLNENFKR